MAKSYTTIQDKLKAYKETSIDTTSPKHSIAQNSKVKSTLLALAPFAAGALIMPNTAQAQCGQGTAVFNPTGGVFGEGQLDVDGDGVADFDFDIAGGLFITPVGTMSVGLQTASYIAFAGASSNITPTSPPNGFGVGGFGYVQMSTNAYFNNGTAASYFVPIRDAAGNLGFIRIVKDGAGGFTVDTVQTGVAVSNVTQVNTADCSPNLPVELLSFDANPDEGGIALKWVTATEIDNKGFEVQRSMDGVNFHKIGWVDGEGKSTRQVTYKFMDEEVKNNTTYYYRLRQMDFDGKEDYSAVQTAEIKDKDLNFKVSPNPALVDSEIQININAGTAYQGNIQIFDIAGKIMQTLNIDVIKGENTINLTTNTLANGTYVLKMVLGNETRYQKLIVQ